MSISRRMAPPSSSTCARWALRTSCRSAGIRVTCRADQRIGSRARTRQARRCGESAKRTGVIEDDGDSERRQDRIMIVVRSSHPQPCGDFEQGQPIWEAIAESRITATRVTRGAISLSSSSHFPRQARPLLYDIGLHRPRPSGSRFEHCRKCLVAQGVAAWSRRGSHDTSKRFKGALQDGKVPDRESCRSADS